MIKIERTSVMNMDNAIRGARNPMNSWAKMDSYYDEKAQKGGGTYYLYRTDMDGNNKEMLLESPVLPASLNFDDDYVYFRQFRGYKIENTVDSRDIYRMSKKDPTKIEKIATLPEDAFQIYTVPGLDILFVTAFDMGVAGVALATVIAQTLSAIMTLIALFKTDTCVKLYVKKILLLEDESKLALGHSE